MTPVICPKGHRSSTGVEGDRCGAAGVTRGSRCTEKLSIEPAPVWCWRCSRGIYVLGFCCACGAVDAWNTADAGTYPTGRNVTVNGQVRAPLTDADRQAKARDRATARKIIAARESLTRRTKRVDA